jgi:hypothetical protein
VVAEREHVRARRQQFLRELRRDPGAIGDVLGVDDAEAGAELLLQPRKPLFDSPPAGRAEDVGNEEDLYGNVRVAAGWTDMAT